MSEAPPIGYVKLHRQLLGWEWIGDPIVLAVFVQILLRTNREPKRWQGIDIPAGSFFTSRTTLAERCGLTEKQVRRALDVLEQGRTIERTRAGQGLLLSLVKWEEYQESEGKKGRLRADQGPNIGPTEGRERATTKEVEKERSKEVEKGAALLFPSWSGEPFKIAWERWRAYKAEQGDRYKPIGEQAILSKLAKEYTNDGDFITAMEHSMANGWKGIFKPRNTPTLNIGGGMTKEQADEEMRQIRIKYGRDPDNGWVGDEECSRPLLIYMGRIKERKAV